MMKQNEEKTEPVEVFLINLTPEEVMAKEKLEESYFLAWTSRVKICISTYQIILQIPAMFEIKMGSFFSFITNGLAFVNCDFDKMVPSHKRLFGISYIEEMAITTIFPIAVGMLAFLYVTICSFERSKKNKVAAEPLPSTQMLPNEGVTYNNRKQGKQGEQENKAKVQEEVETELTQAKKLFIAKNNQLRERWVWLCNFVMWMSFFILPIEASKIFKTFLCVDMDPNGDTGRIQKFLSVDLSVRCDSKSYKFGYAWAIFMTIVYPFGIPVMFLYILVYYRVHRDERTKEQNVGRMAFIRDATGFLFRTYKAKYFYWELIESLKRIFFPSVLSILLPGSKSQLVLSVVLSFSYLVLCNHIKPFVLDESNMLLEIGNTQIFAIFFCSLVLKTQSLSDQDLPTSQANEYAALDVFTTIITLGLLIFSLRLSIFEFFSRLSIQSSTSSPPPINTPAIKLANDQEDVAHDEEVQENFNFSIASQLAIDLLTRKRRLKDFLTTISTQSDKTSYRLIGKYFREGLEARAQQRERKRQQKMRERVIKRAEVERIQRIRDEELRREREAREAELALQDQALQDAIDLRLKLEREAKEREEEEKRALEAKLEAEKQSLIVEITSSQSELRDQLKRLEDERIARFVAKFGTLPSFMISSSDQEEK